MKALVQNGFTLLELLIVIGIMGLLGTVSVSAFRGLRQGMEERGAMQVVDEFIRAAYRRAIIDRTPTAIYFWNETVNDETVGKKLEVVGHAVAVRRAGRITRVNGQFLLDEFGDLAYEAYTDEEGQEDPDDTSYQNTAGRYLYQMGKTSFSRSVVSTTTVRRDTLNKDYLTTRGGSVAVPIRSYAYYVQDAGGATWKVGDAYGFEFAELTLSHNFIFGSGYSSSAQSPERQVGVMTFAPSGAIGGGNVTVSALRLDKTGAVAFQSIGTSENPSKKR